MISLGQTFISNLFELFLPFHFPRSLRNCSCLEGAIVRKGKLVLYLHTTAITFVLLKLLVTSDCKKLITFSICWIADFC